MAKQQASFESILQMPSDMAVPPKPVPSGQYIGMVVGHAQPGEAATGTRFWTITFQLQEVLEGSVDNDDLQAALTQPDGNVQALRDKTLASRFFDTPAAAYRLKNFLVTLGIADKEKGKARPLADMMDEIPGRQVMLTVTHTISRRGDGSVYAEVTGYSAV